jgi:hypothetical protein
MADHWRVLMVNLRPAEFEDIAVLAQLRGVSLSDVVRYALGLVPECTATERDKAHLQLVGGHR